MPEGYKTVNIEQGMPLVEQAICRMTYEISSAKAQKYRAVKLIHGYGSSGTGGRIRIEGRKYLESLKRRGQLRHVIYGENFSIFDADTRAALALCGALRADRDLERHNNGITVVVL